MDHDLLFSSVPERWREICDFPEYEVSDWGRVRSIRRQVIITPTCKNNGGLMIGLMSGNQDLGERRVQVKRSLALLVAREFLADPGRPAFNTPIHLDGDRTNNRYTNLAWRPLNFARKYMQQFFDEPPLYDGEVEDVETGIIYKDLMTVATTFGLIAMDVRIAMLNGTSVWPTRQIFAEPVR